MPEWVAFMTVMPNGITAVQELGVHAVVQRVGFPAGGLDRINEHGEIVGQRRFDTDTLTPLSLTRAGLASMLGWKLPDAAPVLNRANDSSISTPTA